MLSIWCGAKYCRLLIGYRININHARWTGGIHAKKSIDSRQSALSEMGRNFSLSSFLFMSKDRSTSRFSLLFDKMHFFMDP